MDYEGLNFKNFKPFANGGVTFGPSIEKIGEGVTTSKDNPEVLQPLEKLKRLLEEEKANK